MIMQKISSREGCAYTIQEQSGLDDPVTLAEFSTFKAAGLVMRYLKGSVMRSGDQAAALELMQDYDARQRARKER